MGPVWKDGSEGEPKQLHSAIVSSIQKAEELEVETLAFPAISSGIFGFPKDKCGDIFMETIYEYFNKEKQDTSLKRVSCTIIDKPTLEEFYEAFDRKSPGHHSG